MPLGFAEEIRGRWLVSFCKNSGALRSIWLCRPYSFDGQMSAVEDPKATAGESRLPDAFPIPLRNGTRSL